MAVTSRSPSLSDVRYTPPVLYRSARDIRSGSDEYLQSELKAFETLKNSEISSRSLQLVAVFAVLDSQLNEIAKYPDNWDSYGAPAPSVNTLNLTRHLLQAARLNLVEPTTVVASAEGGVATYFVRSRKISYIEYQNSGEAVLGMYGDQVPTIVVEIEMDDQSTKEALNRIREYFLP